MEITVIIPTFDRKAVIGRAIRSVIGQTLAPAEIIVVDDGSSDATGTMIAQNFPGVRLLLQDNAGVSAARNRGIEAARSPWIAFLDSDDEWMPHKLAEQAALVAADPELMVCHTEEIWVRDSRRVNPGHRHAKPRGWIFRHCLPLCCVSPSSILLHRSVLDKVGTFDTDLPACEDYDLWLRIFHQYRAGLVDQPCLVKYGGHDDQLSRRHWGMDRFRVAALDKCLRTLPLEREERTACLAMLERKCRILIQGMERRGNESGARHYRELVLRWRTETASC